MTYDQYCLKHALLDQPTAQVKQGLIAQGLTVTERTVGQYAVTTVALDEFTLFQFSNFGKKHDDPTTISQLFFVDTNATHMGAMIVHEVGYPLPSKTRYWLRVSLKFDIVVALLAIPIFTYFEAIAAFFRS